VPWPGNNCLIRIKRIIFPGEVISEFAGKSYTDDGLPDCSEKPTVNPAKGGRNEDLKRKAGTAADQSRLTTNINNQGSRAGNRTPTAHNS
jgi:hypothetical protein